MRRITAVIVALGLATAIGGCGGTVSLNKTITGTECATREECLKDLKYTRQDKGDIVIVIEPYYIDSWAKNYLGYRPLDKGTKNYLQGNCKVISTCVYSKLLKIRCLLRQYFCHSACQETTAFRRHPYFHPSGRMIDHRHYAPGTPRWYIDYAAVDLSLYIALIKGKEVRDRCSLC
ncbi:MAG: hypothetical protein U0411_09680 [Thermodesulfovibrionales bacterium]